MAYRVFYDVKLHDQNEEKETIEYLGYIPAYALIEALKRLQIKHIVKRYRVTEGGDNILEGYGLN